MIIVKNFLCHCRNIRPVERYRRSSASSYDTQCHQTDFDKGYKVTIPVPNLQSWFFSSTGHRPASLCHGLLSVVRPLTFSLNIFFSETTYRILMKFYRNVPAMVLFRISRKNLIPSKTLVAMATKLKKI